MRSIKWAAGLAALGAMGAYGIFYCSTCGDKAALAAAGGKREIVLRIPSGDKAPPPFAEVVELGLPFCGGDNKPSEQGCGEALPEKFQVRTDPQGGFSNGGLPWANKGEKVAQDSIIAIGDSRVMNSLVGKPEEYLSLVGWNQRQTEILAQLEKVSTLRTSLQQRLTVLAQKGKSFAL